MGDKRTSQRGGGGVGGDDPANPRCLIIADNNIRADVVEFLRRRGHEVRWSRDIIDDMSPDRNVAALADSLGAIVLTEDADFMTIIQRRPSGEQKYRRAGRIKLSCPARQSLLRVQRFIGAVELELAEVAALADSRVIVELGTHRVVIER